MSGNGEIRSYRDLLIWQKGMALAKQVYGMTRAFPGDERFGLTAQMRRAAVSVPSNIAEGQARRGRKEFVQFLSHAEGSLAELDTQLMLGVELGYCRPSDAQGSAATIADLQKMMASLRGKLAAGLAADHQPVLTRH
jgi:four helix bundle protein